MKPDDPNSFRCRLAGLGQTLLLALLCAAHPCFADTASTAGLSIAPEHDAAAFSFVFVGCNRLDKDGARATESASTANVAQLRQTFQDIAGMQELPAYVILGGDIVKAKKPGAKTLEKQLSAWVKLVNDPAQNPLLPRHVPLVAFTGNHEVLINKEDGGCKYAQCPNPPAYDFWQKFMGSESTGFIHGGNGPKRGGKDGLLGDERQLSYSFSSNGVLFIILNTDSRIDKDTIGDVPLHWLKKQLAKGQKDASIRHIFVMGHKPLLPSDGSPGDPTGDRTIRAQQAEAFYRLLNDPAGDGSRGKVRAYLAAHAHEWAYTPRLTVGGLSGNVPQIIAGNAGSPPNASWQGPAAYFGFTLIEIGPSGGVTAKSYGRPIGSPYYDQHPAAASLRETDILFAPAQP